MSSPFPSQEIECHRCDDHRPKESHEHDLGPIPPLRFRAISPDACHLPEDDDPGDDVANLDVVLKPQHVSTLPISPAHCHTPSTHSHRTASTWTVRREAARGMWLDLWSSHHFRSSAA